MKSLIFFLIVAALIGGGGYVGAAKLGFLEGMNISPDKGDIAAASEWPSILPGKWKYYRRIRDSYSSWVYEGDVEYSPNGKFTRFITCKYYEGSKGEIKDYCLRIVAGGSYSGEWSIDSSGSYIIESIKTCDVTTGRLDAGYQTKNVSFCETSFSSGNSWYFGNISFKKSRFGFTRFDKNKIVIEGEEFKDGATVKIVFTKLDD